MQVREVPVERMSGFGGLWLCVHEPQALDKLFWLHCPEARGTQDTVVYSDPSQEGEGTFYKDILVPSKHFSGFLI